MAVGQRRDNQEEVIWLSSAPGFGHLCKITSISAFFHMELNVGQLRNDSKRNYMC